MLREGESVAQYRILSLLGAGGMGEVYLAEDPRLGRKVALKLLPAELTFNEERLRRLGQEARAASALNHPNILTVYETGEAEGVHFIVTEYVEGTSLRRRLEREPLPVTEVLDLGIQIAKALSAAHEARIVHRDIKPENIILRRDGIVKVVDFGLAKLTESEQTWDSETQAGMTTPGEVLGTPAYMSPEQVRGEELDHRSDVFSLGIVLYEMFTGRQPFEGASRGDMIAAVLGREPAPLARYTRDVPAEVERIVAKTLRKRRRDRYQTAWDLALDLKSLKDQLEFEERLARLRETEPGARVGHEPPAADTSVRIQADRLHNAPSLPTPVVGRDAELAAVAHVLREPEVRLLVLTGPGGVGKTRLAIRVGEDLCRDFKDGAWFVPLSAITDPGLVATAITTTLEIKEASGTSQTDVLKQHLLERHALLILDNFEQVLEAVTLISELIATCVHLKILVTSREILRLQGEHEYPLQPLSLPPLRPLPPWETLPEFGAVALFLERARAVKPDLSLTRENAAAVAEICVRLDGLPLALELAAARVKLLPPPAMLRRLEQRLPLLTGGARDLPERQRTLRDVIAWSYNLLEQDEQVLFENISVFAGGFALEAAAAVCAADSSEIAILDGLDSLVSKSLLIQKEVLGEEPRFFMLETIREFGLERLTGRGGSVDARRRHARYYLDLANRAEPELVGAGQGAWLDRLEIELDNFRAALDWSQGLDNPSEALKLASALWRFWETRGFLAEGLARLKVLAELSRKSESPRDRLKILYAAGVLADATGQYQLARGFFEENLALNRQVGDRWGIANSLNNLGIVVLRQLDYEKARALYTESLKLWRELGNETAVALSLNNLGIVCNAQGEQADARILHEESLEIFNRLQDRRGAAWSLSHLGDVERDANNYHEARSLYEESLKIFSELGIASGATSALTELGNLSRDQGSYASARTYYHEAMIILGDLGDRGGIARLLDGITGLAALQGNHERAARLAGAAASLRETLGVPRDPPRQSKLQILLETSRTALGQESFQNAWSAGNRMPVERAISYAMAFEPQERID